MPEGRLRDGRKQPRKEWSTPSQRGHTFSVDRYWIVTCFNDPSTRPPKDPLADQNRSILPGHIFNRQRYGPAWIVTSTDKGVTWNTTATPHDFFTGRLGAARLVQFGQNYKENKDGYIVRTGASDCPGV